MPPSRSGSMIPPQRRSRSASMSSLAQVDLNTLDTELVLVGSSFLMTVEYLRCIAADALSPPGLCEKSDAPSTAASYFTGKDGNAICFITKTSEVAPRGPRPISKTARERTMEPAAFDRTDAAIRPLNIQKLLPEASPPKKLDTPSVASRILASAVAPMSSTVEPMIPSDVKLATTSTAPAHIQYITDSSATRPPEVAMMPIGLNPRGSLPSVTENEPFTEMTSNVVVPAAQQVMVPQEPVPFCPPKMPDALEVYLQVQRSVICMQKYVRGFMARRRFFRALEELLQGRP